MRKACLVALIAVALSGCAHPLPVIQGQPIDKVMLFDVLPGDTPVCVENPDVQWAHTDEARTYRRTVCLDLDQVRHWFAHVRASE